MRFVTTLLYAATYLVGLTSADGVLVSSTTARAAGDANIEIPSFASAMNGGILAGITGGTNNGADALCQTFKLLLANPDTRSKIPTFPAGTASTLPALPPALACIEGDAAIALKIAIAVRATDPNGTTSPARDVWTSRGWPGDKIPSNEDYLIMVGILANANIVDMLSGLGSGGGLFPGAGGFPAPPPPTWNFDNAFDRNRVSGTCRVRCPANTLCINERECVTPQPICQPRCTGNQFCQSTVNATLLATINAQLAAGANAGASGSPPPLDSDGRVSITPNANGQIDLGAILNVFRDGGRVDGTCRSLDARCSPQPNQADSCQAGSVCIPFEGCRRCDVCAGLDLGGYFNGSTDPTRFNANITIGRGQGQAQAVAAGAIGIIQAGLNQWSDLIFGAANGDAGEAGAALLPIPADAIAQMQRLLSNLQDGALQIATGASVEARDLIVRANATLAIILGGADARCRANTSFSLDGPLVIRGSATAADIAAGRIGGRFDFPSTPAAGTTAPEAVVNVAGGVALTGDLGATKLSISAIVAAAAAASVPVGQLLKTLGDVYGAEGRMEVNGALLLGGQAFQPTLFIKDGGRVNISVGASGNFSAGALHLAARGIIDIIANTSRTVFQNVTACEAQGVIRVRVASVSAAKSGNLFSYSSTAASIRLTFRCTVKLYDDTGAEITLNNPNTVASRRLLADSTTPSVQWDENGATYGTAATDSSTGGSNPTNPPNNNNKPSTATTTTPVAALVAILVAVVARAF